MSLSPTVLGIARRATTLTANWISDGIDVERAAFACSASSCSVVATRDTACIDAGDARDDDELFLLASDSRPAPSS